MEISELQSQDIEGLAALYFQFRGETQFPEKMKDALVKLEKNQDYIFLGAKNEGSLAGSLLGIVCYELYGECRPFMVVEDVIVAKDKRHSGIGTALMREIESRARARSCSYILFVTDAARTEARRFYKSLGYEAEKFKGYKKYLHHT